jgi:hypothetical protein
MRGLSDEVRRQLLWGTALEFLGREPSDFAND